MVRTPIPRSTGKKLVSILTGPVGLVLWRLLLVVVFIAVMFVLVAGGGFFGGALAALLLSTLISDDVRAAVADVWHARFWRLG
jgi:K+ transporter